MACGKKSLPENRVALRDNALAIYGEAFIISSSYEFKI